MPDRRAFVGEVDPSAGARLWYLDGTGVRQPVAHVVQRSPDGLSWGYAGKGPADAALSILVAATGNRETAEALHEAFMHDILAKLPVNERFALPAAHVEAGLGANGAELAPTHQRRPVGHGEEPDGEGQYEDLDRGGAHLDRGAAALAARARALDERERRLLEREVRVDAMAVAVGLAPEVEPATWLPAEPVRHHLQALVVDSGDDIAEVARTNGLDPRWAAAVAAGTVNQLDVPHVRHVCEGLRCTPYDLWGTEGARSISHAYGPDAWPAATEPLMPVDGAAADVLAPSLDWPAALPAAGVAAATHAPAAPELVRDLGPELVP